MQYSLTEVVALPSLAYVPRDLISSGCRDDRRRSRESSGKKELLDAGGVVFVNPERAWRECIVRLGNRGRSSFDFVTPYVQHREADAVTIVQRTDAVKSPMETLVIHDGLDTPIVLMYMSAMSLTRSNPDTTDSHHLSVDSRSILSSFGHLPIVGASGTPRPARCLPDVHLTCQNVPDVPDARDVIGGTDR